MPRHKYQDTFWDDFSIPASLQRQGSSTKPDYDYTNIGLLFPQNNATEISYSSIQWAHRKKLGTDIYPHIHWVQTSASLPVFTLAYRWYNNSGDPTIGFTTISTDDVGGDQEKFTYPGSGSILQISSFPVISAIAGELVSSQMDIKLYRDDDVINGDVLLKFFDIHYEIDYPGSQEEFTKVS